MFFLYLFIIFCFLFDCFLFFKYKHLSFKGSILNFVFWVLVAIFFFFLTKFEIGAIHAQEFLTGYILERTLSLDNIFVFYVIFQFFKISEEGKERVLFWGIILAIILRIIFILLGAIIISKFYFVMYIFAAFLMFTGIKLLMPEKKEKDFENSFIIRFFKKILPITSVQNGVNFAEKLNGKIYFTQLFLVMIFIAFSDIIFALDSIPAIFGITLHPFIVISANFFSLMGLRAIFSLITYVISYFHCIKYALSVILIFIGVKMAIAKFFHIPIFYSLAFIFISIAIAILFSIFQKNEARNI